MAITPGGREWSSNKLNDRMGSLSPKASAKLENLDHFMIGVTTSPATSVRR